MPAGGVGLPAGALACLLVLSLIWHIRENRDLRRFLNTLPVNESARLRVTRLAWGRSVQLLTTLILCLVLAVCLQWRPAPRPDLPLPEIPEDSKITEESTAITPAPVSQQLLVAPQVNVADLFAPDPTLETPQQERLDELKRRYESLFVNYLYLFRCRQAEEADFYALNAGLSRELASLNGPGRLSHDILTAAKGSYDEVYAKVSCNNSGTEAASFRSYVSQLKQQQASWMPIPDQPVPDQVP